MTADVDDPLHVLARAAFAALRRGGEKGADGAVSLESPLSDGQTMKVAYRGPAMPENVPPEVASPELVVAQGPGWEGAHRLRVEAPLPVFDLLWNPDEPTRILYFSRGDWEDDLLAAAN